jgi:hypothetical protein
MKESEARESQRDFPWSEKDKQERNNKRKKEERELFVYGLRDFADTGSFNFGMYRKGRIVRPLATSLKGNVAPYQSYSSRAH